MRFRTIHIIIAIAALTLSAAAYAAKRGQVSADTSLFSERSETGAPLESLPSGTPLMMSDVPRDGFYKVKTPSGKIGYVPETAVSANAAAPTRPMARGAVRSAAKPKPRIRVLGGIAMFNASSLGTLINVGSISNGTYLGFDFRYNVSPKLGLLFRLEKLGKSFSATDDSTVARTFDIAISSMPIMGGIEYQLKRSSNFSLTIAGLGGLASTSLTSTYKEGATPNEVSFNKSATTFEIKLDANLHVTPKITIFGELGYRSLKLADLKWDGTASGDDLFKTNGVAQTFDLDLSGPLFGIGLGYNF